ncbi:MAG: aspartate carbamoyltransferase catalytic subunit [Candidatus Obscuribacterales bacterium]|nr:aspartate carbamoyltransferase catalytic subunit [Candidatus Obscuribacterales bacterium]
MTEQTFSTVHLSQKAKELSKLDGLGVQLWRKRRHLLDTDDLSSDELTTALHAAMLCKEMMKSDGPQALLAEKTVANLFYENSTRTRSSFELAAKRLGATVINVDIASSSVAKGETIIDTGRTLTAMGVDALVQRHNCSGAALQIVREFGEDVQVINAGDGWHAHPSQALLDYFTMWEICKELNGAKIAIVGDITHSRVARSNIALLSRLGADIHLAGPPTLLPDDLSKLGVTVHTQIEAAIENARFIMVLRLQLERQQQGLIPSIGEYKRLYRMDHARLKLAADNCKVFHPGPMNRDLEISNSLADDAKHSLVRVQVQNGVAMRMAILYLLLSSR